MMTDGNTQTWSIPEWANRAHEEACPRKSWAQTHKLEILMLIELAMFPVLLWICR